MQYFSVIFQGATTPHILSVKANVLSKSLELIDPETNSNIQNINFGSCYYGCNLTNLSIIFNNSPEPVNYVVILEEKGVGSEIVG